jgi:hypothetical protein
MQRSKRISSSSMGSRFWKGMIVALIATCAGAGTGVAADSGAPQGQVTATWQHHHASFTYYGITALYSCDGLEDNIRALLLHFGARKDLKVSARGCPHGPSVPGPNAIIETDFYSPSPSTDSNAADTVPARWTPVEVSPTHPYFMGRGDCELIGEMKDLITKNFTLRDLSYRADCTPHEVNINDFTVKAQALKAVKPA